MQQIHKFIAMSGANPNKVHIAYQYGNSVPQLLCGVRVQHIWQVEGLEVNCVKCLQHKVSIANKYGRKDTK